MKTKKILDVLALAISITFMTLVVLGAIVLVMVVIIGSWGSALLSGMALVSVVWWALARIGVFND